MTLEECRAAVGGLEKKAMEEARLRWSRVAKPLDSLGLLEGNIIRMAGIQGSARVRMEKKALVVMCADNGVVEEGVTQCGREVTAIVTRNITKGNSCVCIMAECAGVEVFPVDIGVAADLKDTGNRYPLIERKVAWGTKNFLEEPAMTRAETLRAVETGIEIAGDLKARGYDLIATGEMGIGNTTTSSAVASVLLGRPPEVMTGRGAGLSDRGLARKRAVIAEAIARRRPDPADALSVLSCVGGLDLAGLAGIFLGAAACRLPVLVDGFISGTAAMAAAVLCPEAREYMIASHVSAEPAGELVLEALGLKPFIRAGMCLGEGTGAVGAVPLLAMALEVYSKMSTFQEIEIEGYRPFS